ncbi:hypothetical protein D7Y39_05245 [Stenotrophomonas maltophilia]|uniref:Rha family transcriptional regulator n=1 Tax=Stenotrophomonas maltophilia TaxID=40324 RepID=UPI0015DEE8E8|nr:Rha family transcriptional regulator [Stenotrophomonas maltophilia]MBA0289239.1 hypothetical protein [Stenotrophomonas maltophilia]
MNKTERGLAVRSPVLALSPEGRVFTTSTAAAEHFDKRHGDVLRAIETLLNDLKERIQWLSTDDQCDGHLGEDHQHKTGLMVPEELFEAAEIEVRIGRGTIRRDPIYNLSRDGFALLAMGFTGKRALGFKLAYIAAFNAMEAKLRAPYVAPLAEDLDFAKGLRMKDKLLLHDQARKASRALSSAADENERRQAYWQLYQINTALGIPMPTMNALGVVPLSRQGSTRLT